jgi:hypothetical protein
MNKQMIKLNNFLQLFLTVLSLPSVYKIKSIKQIFLLLILIISSIITTKGIIIYFDDLYIFKIIILKLTLLYFLFLIFNLIIRFYVMFYKILKYFIKNNIKKDLVITYYLYNIFCIIITLFLLYKIYKNMIILDINFQNYILTYIFLFSVVLALMYIDYISENEIKILNYYNKNILFFIFIFIFLILLLNILKQFDDEKLYSYIIKNNLLNKFSLNMLPNNNIKMIEGPGPSNKSEITNDINKPSINKNKNFFSFNKNKKFITNNEMKIENRITKFRDPIIKSKTQSTILPIQDNSAVAGPSKNLNLENPNQINTMEPAKKIPSSFFYNTEKNVLDLYIPKLENKKYLYFLENENYGYFVKNLSDSFNFNNHDATDNYTIGLMGVLEDIDKDFNNPIDKENFAYFIDGLEYALDSNLFKLNNDLIDVKCEDGQTNYLAIFQYKDDKGNTAYLNINSYELKLLKDIGDLNSGKFENLNNNYLFTCNLKKDVESLNILKYYGISEENIEKLKIIHREANKPSFMKRFTKKFLDFIK